MRSKTGGYSGTPLARKLGIKDGSRLVIRHAPIDYFGLFAPLPPAVTFEKKVSGSTDIVHLFSDDRVRLQAELTKLRNVVRSNCAIWVSWPKKASGVPTDVTEDVIRDLALPLGFVDVKVCSVNEVWSGLKLVIRKELR